LTTFKTLKLIEPLQRALADENYDTPTPIQSKAIPPALDGYDVLGCAQTGTGKTAAFALPILDEIGFQNRRAIPKQPFALVLSPTRELAIQIGASFDSYGRHLSFRKAVIFGGVNQHQQVKSLARGAHVLVATPGRLLDLLNQGHVDLSRLETFVLDEADRMLDMGFLPDLKRIMQRLPDERQSLFFSATLPPKIIQLAERLLFEPVAVTIKPKTNRIEAIDQKVFLLPRSEKQTKLQNILAEKNVGQVIVFTRTKRSADNVEKKLKRIGVNASAIHSNKSQSARQRILGAFRDGRVQILIATDIAARGIDVDGVTHVINYDLPADSESYTHRIGRTGRAGSTGVAITFCQPDQCAEMRAIEKAIGKKLLSDEQAKQGVQTTPTAGAKANRSGKQGRSGKPGRSAQSTPRASSHRVSNANGRPSKRHTQSNRRSTNRRSKSVQPT
jgi:ATP-dependent RNA helicase RhlE